MAVTLNVFRSSWNRKTSCGSWLSVLIFLLRHRGFHSLNEVLTHHKEAEKKIERETQPLPKMKKRIILL